MRNVTWCAICIGLASGAARHGSAEMLDVPSSRYPTIQSAIDAAAPGDYLHVNAGTDDESIDFRGKAITIQGGPADRLTLPGKVRFHGGESRDSLLVNFILTAGVDVEGASPSIQFCRFFGDGSIVSAGGHGAASAGAFPRFLACEFSGGKAWTGGAYDVRNSRAVFESCLFHDNEAIRGGGLHVSGSSVDIVHCTFARNLADDGSALFVEGTSSVRIVNSILWDEVGAPAAEVSAPVSAVLATHCDIRGGFPGAGNIDRDPCFRWPMGGDFHLANESPCIDQGTSSWGSLPGSDFEGAPRIFGLGPDIGADENLTQTIDNGGPGTSSTGHWPVSGAPDPFGTDSVYTKSRGAAYSFATTIGCCARTYTVAIRWTCYPSRCRSALVKVHDAMGLVDAVFVDQQTRCGEWVVLGTYPAINGPAVVVEIVAQASDCSTCADAVRWLPTEEGTVKWQYRTETDRSVFASPVVAPDGTVYHVTSPETLHAIRPDGTLAWARFEGSPITASPAVGADGTLYVPVEADRSLYALGPDGRETWRYPTGGYPTSPAVGPDGTIYVASRIVPGGAAALHALDPDGVERWTVPIGGDVSASPAVDWDGTVYLGSTSGDLHAIRADGRATWRHATGSDIFASASMDACGTVYVGTSDGKLHAIDAAGSAAWTYQAGGGIRCCPAVARDGTILFGAGDGNLYAVWSGGELRWRILINPWGPLDCSPVVTGDGIVIAGAGAGDLIAREVNGAWRWFAPAAGHTFGGPAVAPDGTIYVASTTGGLTAIHGSPEGGGPGGLADSPWPMLGADPGHTGRVARRAATTDVVVDNGDAATIAQGSWSVSGAAGPYGVDSLYSRQAGARYAFAADVRGEWTVHARWTWYSSRCRDVALEILDGDEVVATPRVDQGDPATASRWQELGRYRFVRGPRVVIVAQGGVCSTSADAVRFVKASAGDVPTLDRIEIEGPEKLNAGAGRRYLCRAWYGDGSSRIVGAVAWSTDHPDVPIDPSGYVQPPVLNTVCRILASYAEGGITRTASYEVLVRDLPYVVTVDNGDPGTSSTGSWRISGGTGPYGTDSLYASATGASYTYEADLQAYYHVLLHWSQYPSRCRNVKVEVYDGTKLLGTVRVDQLEERRSGDYVDDAGVWWTDVFSNEFVDSIRVRIVSPGGCSTCADAVRFARE